MADRFTIEATPRFVNLLLGDDDKVKKKTKKPKPKVSQELRQPQSKAKPASSPQKSSSPGRWPPHLPVFLTVPPPAPLAGIAELEAIRSVLEESKQVVEKLEQKEAGMIQELSLRAKELHDKEFRLPYQKPRPCVVEREACLRCYRENLKDPLKCALVVKTFADCARQASLTDDK